MKAWARAKRGIIYVNLVLCNYATTIHNKTLSYCIVGKVIVKLVYIVLVYYMYSRGVLGVSKLLPRVHAERPRALAEAHALGTVPEKRAGAHRSGTCGTRAAFAVL